MPVFWAAPCVRIYYIHGHVRAHTRCCSCSCCRPAPTLTTTEGQAFLTVPSSHQRSLSPCASRRTNSPTGLLGRLRLFMNRTPPSLVTLTQLAKVAHPHPYTPWSLSSVLRSFPSLALCVFFFKHCATSLPDIELPSSSIASRLPLGSAGTNITAR